MSDKGWTDLIELNIRIVKETEAIKNEAVFIIRKNEVFVL
jgi:hypothetical protein